MEAVENGSKSIKSTYTPIAESTPQKPRKPKVEERKANPQREFIKEAVIMLIQNSQHEAAELLMAHFIEQSELEAFRSLIEDSTDSSLVDSTSRK